MDRKDLQSLPDMSYVPGVRSVSIIARLSLASQSSSFIPFLSGTPQYQHTYVYNTQYVGTQVHITQRHTYVHIHSHKTQAYNTLHRHAHHTHTQFHDEGKILAC